MSPYSKCLRFWQVTAFAGLCALPVFGSEPPESPAAEKESGVKSILEILTKPAETQQNAAPVPPSEQAIKPRVELRVPSLDKLKAEALRSHAGVFVDALRSIVLEMAGADSEGVGDDELIAIARQIKDWPDTSITGVVFAADTQGRARWAVKVDWPIADLHSRVKTILSTEAAQELFRGIKIENRASGYEIKLPDSTLAFLLPLSDKLSVIASHDDIAISTDLLNAEFGEIIEAQPLIVSRLNFKDTEKDSGATFFSDFDVLNSLTYTGRVNEAGEWIEQTRLEWPPIAGMGVKVFLDRIKHTFFVPDRAFGALVVNASMAPGMLDGMAGFGPQFMFDDSGNVSLIGEAMLGPIGSRTDGQLCVTVLPGTGFLPAPDIVIQSRAKRAEQFAEEVRKAIEEMNKLFREREQKPPWREATVRDRSIFWRQENGFGGGLMMPLSMRPVLFTTKETDSGGKERDMVVLAWTTTSPEAFVQRWLDFPRSKERKTLPSAGKPDGEIWVNWKSLYRMIHPYIDLALSTAGTDVLLPKADDISSKLSDAKITADLKYAGLTVSHQGPFPLGALVVPGMVGASIAQDASSASDVARERFACERLRILFHHAKLFKKDLGRWPAEIGELDGYVDFEGNPGLLQLQLSSRKQWSKWFDDIFEKKEEKKEEEEDEGPELDDDLYVINWSRDRWTLGFAPDTFEHLNLLYIDQDGQIHRTEKSKLNKTADKAKDAEKKEAPSADRTETTISAKE